MNTNALPNVIFVTGTDTGIGKTVVSALLTAGLKASYWKPIQSGLEEETDTEFVRRVAEVTEKRIIPERYRLNEPLSPHASAKIDGKTIHLDDFEMPGFTSNHLVIEGAGGLLVPLNEKDMIIDLIQKLEVPVLLVVRSELGTLNHTFLSLEALRNRGIPIIGVIMNGPPNVSNRKAIEHYGQVEILGELDTMKEVTKQKLISTFKDFFNP